MTHTFDVAVVGAGAVGSAAAWAVAQAGRDVVVVERHSLGHDRGGSHGVNRLFRLEFVVSDYLELALQSEPIWRELEAESGETLLTRTGGIEHGNARAQIERFRLVFEKRSMDHEVLDPSAAHERWPGMRFETPVLYHPGTGELYADRCVSTLQRLAALRGAEFRPSSAVTDIRILDDGDMLGEGLVELETPGGSLRARQVVTAVGRWTKELLGHLAALPEIVCTQEQPRHFAVLDATAAWPTFVHWRTGARPFGSAESYGLLEAGMGVKVGLHATGPGD